MRFITRLILGPVELVLILIGALWDVFWALILLLIGVGILSYVGSTL